MADRTGRTFDGLAGTCTFEPSTEGSLPLSTVSVARGLPSTETQKHPAIPAVTAVWPAFTTGMRSSVA
jgi:hypothetical protein